MNRRLEQKTALIVIDIQNDYFPTGQYPQWQAQKTLDVICAEITSAQANGELVLLIQHVGTNDSPFFKPETLGVKLHNRLLELVPTADVIEKHHADSFLNTRLAHVLKEHGIERIRLCGMMTQNCVAFTAMSPMAEHFEVRVLGHACTSVDPMVHGIALRAMADRVTVELGTGTSVSNLATQ